MEKVKKAFHIRKNSKAPPISASDNQEGRESVDAELAAMSPDERAKYLKDFEDAEKEGGPKKGSLLDRLIERGNKKTEDQIEREAREARDKDEGVVIR